MSSSFYRKPGDQSAGKMREFNVGAPELAEGLNIPNQEGYELSAAERDELQRYRQNNSGGPKLGEHARKRVEILSNIGRLFKEVELDGIVFTLKTLKDKETREATLSIFSCANDADAAYELRRQTLARSICKIDGQDVELALGGNEFERRLELIDGMENVIVSKLYTNYNELKKEAHVKYGVETESQVKEVVEDIKK